METYKKHFSHYQPGDEDVKPLTWDEVRQAIEMMPEEKRQEQALVWGFESGGTVVEILQTNLNMYNPSGDGCETFEEYSQGMTEEEKQDFLEQNEVVVPAGTYIMFTESVLK